MSPRAVSQISLYCSCISISLLFRALIGLHSYSGQGQAPQYGDYEAQRHWMEITTNLPAKDWYKNTNDNVLGYWGLDYPPLSAYQSWLCGKALQAVEPEAVALYTSRGHETPHSKAWMRLSVIIFDILVFFPATIAAYLVMRKGTAEEASVWPMLAILVQPAALLIDHGHFQYNNISLGLSAGAVAAIGVQQPLLGSCLFCLALNHKHMTLYYAPAFFAHLLGCSLQQRTTALKVKMILKLGGVVILTFAVCWLPYIKSLGSAKEVLDRLAPVRRGLFEDYVANFWCVSSLLLKWRRLFSQQALLFLSASATLACCAPSVIQQIRRPSQRGLVYCMANTAFAFYMFAYQVHEKSVMLMVLPVTLLATSEPLLAAMLPVVAAFSMYPLLRKDGLPLAYAASLLLWFNMMPGWGSQRTANQALHLSGDKASRWSRLSTAGGSLVVGASIHLLDLWQSPPKSLPYLHDAFFVTFAFIHLAATGVYLNIRQWQIPVQNFQRQMKED